MNENTIELSKPIEDKSTKQEWTEIKLREPTLFEAEQFQDKLREANNPLTAARLLIHLVSGVPESTLKTMSVSDFRKCDKWINRFFS
jgi:hypothetical protein